ncbi:MAG: methyltransferase [Muribaculaceae bacterium]|nr:methyltransferase [Muribaculaceae bacterium]
MEKKDGVFYFKKFAVSHSRSSMKVGVDGVLIGAWANPDGERILDVGCGSGLISLMMAQRNPYAEIIGIDIDKPSVEEAYQNFAISPWKDRLRCFLLSFDEVEATDLFPGKGFDLIVSNPPFFDSGIKILDNSRKIARHKGSLSPEILINKAACLLNPRGKLAMVVPVQYSDYLLIAAKNSHLLPKRITYVRYHDTSTIKRVLLEFGLQSEFILNNMNPSDLEENSLTMFNSDGTPTIAYRNLCHNFYLKF